MPKSKPKSQQQKQPQEYQYQQGQLNNKQYRDYLAALKRQQQRKWQ